MTDFHSIPIGSILPQQPPFRFVDHLESYTEEATVISFTVREGSMLLEEDGSLSAAGVMEHMAQASAARVGYVTVYILHKPVSIGFIGQVKHFVLNRLPRLGEQLRTTVYLKQEIFGISLADIEVRSGEELLASATLKTALNDDK
jgi:predicted hotdog family 3-hydroxylacyl-ACP dehydratase